MRKALHGFAGAAGAMVMLGLAAPAAGAAAAAVPGGAGGGVIHAVHGIGGGVNTSQSSNWSGYNIGADSPQVSTGTTFTSVSGEWSEDTVAWIEETPLEIGTTCSGIATMPNLARVRFLDAAYNRATRRFRAIDEIQLDNNNVIEATPSDPGAKKNNFNDCTWATRCPAP